MNALPRSWLPRRRPDTNKNDYGHVLVIGGARGLTGAPRLAAAGALRGGAGLVTTAVPASLEIVAAVGGPWEALTLGLPEFRSVVGLRALARVRAYLKSRRITAIALGPGLSAESAAAPSDKPGRLPSAAAFVRGLLKSCSIPVVLDADGLNAVARTGWPARLPPLILTPHPGEAARLLGMSPAAVQEDRKEAARKLAVLAGGVCVLKGHRTLVTDGRRWVVNLTGNPGMATGGSGDVLAGLIAALIPQVAGPNLKERLWRSAVIGVRLHGLAGDLATRRIGRAPLAAGDLLDHLPAAFRRSFGAAV